MDSIYISLIRKIILIFKMIVQWRYKMFLGKTIEYLLKTTMSIHIQALGCLFQGFNYLEEDKQ